MSQWTHINASIRFDTFFNKKGKTITEKEFGKICSWEDENTSHWNNPGLPCGSEGSIKYWIIKTNRDNCLGNTAVLFVGDLRDYDDEKEIISYFKKITKDKFIRSGILEIEIEYNDTIIYNYNVYNHQWIEIKRIKYDMSKRIFK